MTLTQHRFIRSRDVLALGLFFPATGSEFVSESLDLRFESVDALGFLRECRLEFVDALAQ